MLDEKLIFSNTKTDRKDYASKRLPYPLEKGDTSAWDKLLSVLYSPSERRKIEWAIGSIVSGDSRKLQKFMVFYGAAGTGKSTIIGIIEQLFEGYTATFDSKALGQSSNAFALEPFKKNPLVAIEHDGDLSRIEDNTRINSLVSHERMSVNEKFSKMYENNFKCFLFMGTNRPVKITDAKSGLLRRLIDVSPTGEKLRPSEYKQLMKQISFELGAIAQHCMDVYLEEPDAYLAYVNSLGDKASMLLPVPLLRPISISIHALIELAYLPTFCWVEVFFSLVRFFPVNVIIVAQETTIAIITIRITAMVNLLFIVFCILAPSS